MEAIPIAVALLAVAGSCPTDTLFALDEEGEDDGESNDEI
jgi:hypothetical protein